MVNLAANICERYILTNSVTCNVSKAGKLTFDGEVYSWFGSQEGLKTFVERILGAEGN